MERVLRTNPGSSTFLDRTHQDGISILPIPFRNGIMIPLFFHYVIGKLFGASRNLKASAASTHSAASSHAEMWRNRCPAGFTKTSRFIALYNLFDRTTRYQIDLNP